MNIRSLLIEGNLNDKSIVINMATWVKSFDLYAIQGVSIRCGTIEVSIAPAWWWTMSDVQPRVTRAPDTY